MNVRALFIKIRSWEYWPQWIVYFPVNFYFLYLACKARSLFFFSATNPSIETGGMFFESKWKIFKLIPTKYFPPTIFIEANENMESICNKMEQSGIAFPIIAKPDRGERGWGVQKINTHEELEQYTHSAAIDFLIQSFVKAPLECSVFYYRHPSQEKGIITSVTLKTLLSVIGDGTSTIEQLIRKNDRAYLQLETLKLNATIDFNAKLKEGEEQNLVPYGNHVLGAMFMNYNHIIDEQLVTSFDHISKQIDGFYYGRFDLGCNSIADLKAGLQISLFELNGAGAEPAHIYDPSFSYCKAQQVLAQHFKMMYDAAMANHTNGIPFMSYGEYKQTKKLEKQYKRRYTRS